MNEGGGRRKREREREGGGRKGGRERLTNASATLSPVLLLPAALYIQSRNWNHNMCNVL